MLDETESYATEEEIEKELAMQREDKETQEKEKAEKIKYGIPAENIYKTGDVIRNPFLTENMEFPEENIEYTVQDIQIADSLDMEEYPSENFCSYEEVAPWVNEDGTLKTHSRYTYAMTAEGQTEEEPKLEEVSSKYVIVKMKVKNVSGVGNESVNLAPDLIVKEEREDGGLSCYGPEFIPANEGYSLQWGSGDGANFPIYIDQMYYTDGIERIKSSLYRPLADQEELEYTLVYVADADVLDSMYLKFYVSYAEEMLNGNWITNPYVKVTE